MGKEWAQQRRAAGLAHRAVYQRGEETNSLGQPRCRLCGGLIEGLLLSVEGISSGSTFYHEDCYGHRWSRILDRLG